MADVVPISDRVRAAREAVLRAHLEAHSSGDVEGVLATFRVPRLELVPSGRVYEGAEQVRAHLEDRRRSFPDQRFEIVALHHSEHVVVSEFWMSATHEGAFHGVEPTGRRFRTRMAAIFEFDDEDDPLITCQRLYYDAGTVARQLA